MSTSTKFLAGFAGKQTVLGTPVSATFQLPFVGEYEDAQEDHSAEYDSGFWTPTTIVEQVATHARFTLNGTAFFELMPVLFNAGHDHITVGGVGPFIFDDAVSPSAVGVPRPYTFFFGGNENIGATGPMIRIQDGHLESFSLAGNINTKEVALTSQWFGATIHPNSAHVGFAKPAANLPSPLGMMKTLLATLELQDATTTGGDFATMTATDKALLDWTFACDFGLRPAWSADENQSFYSTIRHVMPVATFAAAIRMTETNYALVRIKAVDRTFQELQLTLNGANSELLKLKMTGRWLPNVIAHSRSNDEVVMQGTFQLETPYTQVTTPHWFSWELDTNWSH